MIHVIHGIVFAATFLSLLFSEHYKWQKACFCYSVAMAGGSKDGAPRHYEKQFREGRYVDAMLCSM